MDGGAVSTGPARWARVPTIAAQAHRILVAQEEARCVALEAKPGKRKTPVKRHPVPVPVVRLGLTELCHRIEFLWMVTEYDYDLADPAFRQYCVDRGTACGAALGSRRWDFFERHDLSKHDYLVDPYFQNANEHEGKRHRYTKDEMESGWKVIQLGRAVLQDAWEIYRSTADSAPRSMTPSLFDDL